MRAAGLWASLMLAILVAWAAGRPPAPVPASAPPTVFSAERAFAHVQAIARAPHPTGSADAARVRAEIVRRLQALGLVVQVRSGVGLAQPKWAPGRAAAAQVENIVGLLPGRDRSLPAIALLSHSDSVPNSPGAADDAAGAAASIEIVRAIAAAGAPLRDVMVVVTDGEEAGLLGADAFFTDDPLARRVGAVVNLETRGSGGRAQMFETAPNAGGWVALYRRTASGGGANSLMPFVYHRMPNGTDFTEASEAGVPGLNVSFIGRQFDYHTAHATPGALDRGSLQSLGEQALGPARALAFSRDLPAPEPDLVYLTPPWLQLIGGPLIAYPVAVGWALAIVEAALLASVAWRAWSFGLISLGGAALGAATVVVMTVAAGSGLHLLTGPFGHAYGDIQQRYAVLGRYAWALAAAGLIAAALALAVLRAARVRATTWSLWVGALALVLALSWVAQIAAPTTAFALAWPLLPALLAAAGVLLFAHGRLSGAAPVLLIAVMATLGLSDVFGFGAAVFSALGVDLPAALAVITPLAAVLLIPLAAGKGGVLDAAAPTVALTLGLVALAAAASPRPGTLDRPALSQAFYLAEPARGRYLRVSAVPRLDDWSRTALTADGGAVTRAAQPPFLPAPVHAAVARPAVLAPPRIALERTGDRILLRVSPARSGREIRLRLRASTAITGLLLQDRAAPLLERADRWAALSFAAPPATGVALSFPAPPSGARLEVESLELSDGWPAGVRVPARPATLQPWGWSDTTQVIARAAFVF